MGHLGSYCFPAGWYVYAGSAGGGLRRRLRRYVEPAQSAWWHVDYLRAHAELREVWVLVSSERRECELASRLLGAGGAVVARRFGASDCRCLTHLAYFRRRPRLARLLVQVRLADPRACFAL